MVDASMHTETSQHWLGRLSLACLLAGAFFLPFLPLVPGLEEVLPGIYLWDRQRTAQAVLLLVALVLAAAINLAPSRFPPMVSRRLLVGWAVVAVVSMLSAIRAHYPGTALLDWAWMHGLFALALLSASLLRGLQGRAEPVWLVPVGLASLLYVFWFFVSNSDLLFSYDFREVDTVYPGFSNSRYFADFLVLPLFLAPLAVLRYLPGRRERALGWGIVALLYMLAFVTGARSILAGQLVAHAILLAILRKGYLPLFGTYLRCWAVAFVLFVAIIKVYAPWSISVGAPEVAMAAQPSSPALSSALSPPRLDNSGRGELLEKSLRLIGREPWLGVGGRHYGCYLKGDYADPHNRNNGDAAHPHNAVLQLFVEWGALAGAGVVLATVWFLFRIVGTMQHQTQSRTDLDAALLGALLALGVHAMVTGVLNAPVTQMMLVMLFGWGLARVSSSPTATDSVRVRRALAAVALGLGGSIALMFSSELQQLPESNKQYMNETRVTWYLAPRFWQQGWLIPLCGKI